MNSSKNVENFFETAGRSPSSTQLILNTLSVRYDATHKILFGLKVL